MQSDSVLRRLDECDDRVELERLERMLSLCQRFQNRHKTEVPVWLWQLGDACLVFSPTEAHSRFQTELRQRFPQIPVAVTHIANGYLGYVPPADAYEGGSYQATVSPFQPGCLETLTAACAERISQRDRRSPKIKSSQTEKEQR